MIPDPTPKPPKTPAGELDSAGCAASTCYALRDCHDCRYCGPDRPEGMIRCDHESWAHWDEEMRVFAPDFAPQCDSFDAKLSQHNAEHIRDDG